MGYSLLVAHGYKGDAEEDIADKLLAEGVGFNESKLVTSDCFLVTNTLSETGTSFMQKI